MNGLEKTGGMSQEELLEKIGQSGLKEYGICPENLEKKLRRILEERLPSDGPMIAAGALNNQDTDRMLLWFAKREPEKVLLGLAILGQLLSASKLRLYLPEGETALIHELEDQASVLGVNVELLEGIADTRRMKGGCLCHLETLAALCDVMEDTYCPGAVVAVKTCTSGDVSMGEPIFAPYGTKLTSLLPQPYAGQIKAVQIGSRLCGPSALEEPVTADTILGNGVITVFDESCCMIAMAEERLEAARRVCCGKCTFCREGLGQLYTRIHEITSGKGEAGSLEIMREIGEAMEFSCLCSVGQTGAQFTLDSMKIFGAEYEDHIRRKKCTAGSCPAFIRVYIDPDRCTGCGRCIPACPKDCIEGLPGYIHMTEELDCVKCTVCREACGERAVVRTLGRVPRLPDRLTRVGRFKQY